MGIIRLLLAISVVFHHLDSVLGFRIIRGDLAVQAFFIISGFYMALILNEKYVGARYSYKLFLTNRFLRIYPTYWLILIASVIYSFHIATPTNPNAFEYYAHLHSDLSGIPFVFAMFYDILQNIFVFVSVDFIKINPNDSLQLVVNTAWTLKIELMFYLIAPFIVRKSLRTVVLVACTSLGIRYFVWAIDRLNGYPLNTRFFLGQVCFFLFGVLTYHLYTKLRKKNYPLKMHLTVLSLFILLTFTYNFLPVIRIKWWNFSDWMYFICLIVTIPSAFLYLGKSRVDRFLGNLSYPIYITHLLVIGLFTTELDFPGKKDSFPFLVLLTTILLAMIITKYIEQPIEWYRQLRIKTFRKRKDTKREQKPRQKSKHSKQAE